MLEGEREGAALAPRRRRARASMQAMAGPSVPWRILPLIVVTQFAATSLWFAGNAVMPDLQREAGFPADALIRRSQR
jgi:hypothetical protein